MQKSESKPKEKDARQKGRGKMVWLKDEVGQDSKPTSRKVAKTNVFYQIKSWTKTEGSETKSRAEITSYVEKRSKTKSKKGTMHTGNE